MAPYAYIFLMCPYLICRTALGECVQLVHFADVLPKMFHRFRNLEADEKLSGHANVLQLRHQLAVKAAEGVT